MTVTGATPDRGHSAAQGPGWICCQLGAREHYAAPRALERLGVLDRLLTEAWVDPSDWSSLTPSTRWRDRYAPDLPSARVVSWNSSAAAFELFARCRRANGWPLIVSRNRWFQARVSRWLAHCTPRFETSTLFAYSYAAAEPLRVSKGRGWRTVLCQIDPGPLEERIVLDLFRDAGIDSATAAAPHDYWRAWEEEWRLADVVMVNSKWSRDALTAEGVPPQKIRVVPLAYDPPPAALGFQRSYPAAFSRSRPLRLLFLGQANLRKGLLPLLEAMSLLVREPVELNIVGTAHPAELLRSLAPDNVNWCGAAPRGQVAEYYRGADVFVLPTYSDGFAMTQLEAQAWRLPLLVTRRCGDVVIPGRNGLLLEQITGQAIAEQITALLQDPSALAAMSHASSVPDRFSLDSVGRRLLEIDANLPRKETLSYA